jgi:hypothetical protein
VALKFLKSSLKDKNFRYNAKESIHIYLNFFGFLWYKSWMSEAWAV